MRKNMFNIERSGEEHRSLSYRDKFCVGCGICANLCPTSSLKLGPLVPIARGLIEMDFISINSDSCVFCGLCSIACPFDSLSLSINGTNIKDMDSYPKWDVESKIHDEECIYCGRCHAICPRDSILFERKIPQPADLVRGEISVDKDQCIYCSFCADMCPTGAIKLSNLPSDSNDVLNNHIEVDVSKCIFCGVCKRVCPNDAIRQICSTCMYSDDIKIPDITGKAFISEESCVNCSWCLDICPVDAITITKPFTGSLKLIENEKEDKICKGESCHACLDVCQCKAIVIEDNKSVTNLKFCNLCGACITACPQNIRILSRTSMKLTNINSDSWNDILNSLIIEK